MINHLPNNLPNKISINLQMVALFCILFFNNNILKLFINKLFGET